MRGRGNLRKQSRRDFRGAPLAGAFATLACLASPALAVDKYWSLDGGDWNNPAAWTPAGVPAAVDDTYFGSGVVGTTIVANITANVPDAHRLYLGGATENNQTLVGNATLNHTAGSLHLVGGDSWFHAGNRAGSVGTYNMSGGTFTEDADVMTFGDDGTGFLNLSGNAIITTPNFQMGRWNTGQGPGMQTGGTVNVSGEFNIGRRGTGTYTLNSGTINSNGDFSIGRGDDPVGNPGQPAKGTFTQNNGTIVVGTGFNAGGWAYIGGHDTGTGTGIYNMHGGLLDSKTRIQIAQGPGSTGTFNQDGGVVNAPTAEIGQGGLGTYNLSAGTLNSNGDAGVLVGAWQGGNGVLNVSGNGIINANNLRVGRGDAVNAINQGLVMQTGGTITLTDTLSVGSGNAASKGTYTITGGLIKLGAGGLQIGLDGTTATFNLQGGVVDAQNHNISFGNGDAAFNMTGGTLKNVNTIAFPFNQQGGTLAPVASPGKTTINNGYTLGALGHLDIDINGLVAGTDFDQVVLTSGALNLAGILDTHVGFSPIIGLQFEIIDNQGGSPVVGNFAGLPEGAIIDSGGAKFQISYGGGNGNDVVLTAVVPEPTTLALAGLAFASLLGRRSDRRSRQA